MNEITVPELSLVVLTGPARWGKSSFARKHFKPTEILSSDYCRGLVSDDQNDQAATIDAFDVLRFIARHTGFLPRTRRIAPNRDPTRNRLAGLVPNRESIGLQGGVLAEDRIRPPSGLHRHGDS